MYQSSSTNATEKVCRILKTLSNPTPLRLSDLAGQAELSGATTLRILDTLMAEGFVHRDESSKRYRLGEEALVLGMALQARGHVRDRARASLVRLANLSGDTALLSTRSGLESVCIDREFGPYPIRANYLDIGSRRPLGAGAGSLALLAWLPQDEAATIIELLTPRLAVSHPRITPSVLREQLQRSREQGYAMLLDVVVEQMGGIAVPILGADGRPMAALSLAALSQRISSRLPELVHGLKTEADSLSSMAVHEEAP
jgi:DNA-binding IclR family transcriptional regulator